MSHEFSDQAPAPLITDEVVEQWMQVKDEFAPFGEMVQIDRGNGPEEVVLVDSVYTNPKTTKYDTREPIAIIQNATGQTEEVPVGKYLEWTKFDPANLEVKAEKQTLSHEVVAFGGHQVVEAVTNYQAERRKQREQRAEKLFSVPDYINVKQEVKEYNFDRFFSDDPEPVAPVQPRWNAEKPKPRPPEEEDLVAASRELEYATQKDQTVAAIINKYRPERASNLEMVKILQTSAELRKELGVYLLDKMDHVDVWPRMPSRIARDSQKNANHPGYYDRVGYMTSREYACMIAMSMLDGTFDISRSQSDEITAGSRNRDGLGQHRAAAKILLEFSDIQWSPTQNKTINIWE